MDQIEWEEIHGFSLPSEYDRFRKYIEDLIKAGMAEEIQMNPKYHRRLIYGGRWFKDVSTEVVWRLVPPDFPFRGVWEPVNKTKDT